MSFEFESVNHGQSDTSGLNIAVSHLLEDEEGLSGELGDDELEQVSGGPLPLLVRLGAVAIGGILGLGVAKGAMDAHNGLDKQCIRK
ncbi:class IIb bacteriocin, lactobin A/cerein 7B family [Microcoleus sp. N9_A1]|uniref:class IIb bacteriocin, lactobin A/cerein 7B family n=1 Tax=Microcoleus sp. N9_A1 TaxID=3055380 RepID=UPI002FCFA5D3